jgi:hypothetical protein
MFRLNQNNRALHPGNNHSANHLAHTLPTHTRQDSLVQD